MWFFFFKQKTAYYLRISDWSSDVCSSDLASLIRSRGVMESSELQNRRMPVRPSAMLPASPDSSTAATGDQAATDGVSVLEVCSAADSSENLATKPDSGGRPVISRAQATKDMPRKARDRKRVV